MIIISVHIINFVLVVKNVRETVENVQMLKKDHVLVHTIVLIN
jgi:hypothetical protein